MILVDTSVWVNHLRSADAGLAALLDAGRVVGHPFVTGEIALGQLRQRGAILDALRGLPQATIATDAEVLLFIEQLELFGRGVGYVDAHLLAAARLSPGTAIWTRDRRLRDVADALKVGYAAS